MKTLAKFDITEFVSYNEETKKSTCLFKNCQRQLSGKKPSDIKRHYERLHKIECEVYSPTSSENAPQPTKKKDLITERSFNIKKYVKYNKRTNKSVCLICKVQLTGKRRYEIKRHYERKHRNSAEEESPKRSKRASKSSIKSKINPDEETPRSSKRRTQISKTETEITNNKQKITNGVKFNLEEFAKLDKLTNKYICLVKNCKRKWNGSKPSFIRRHYERVHEINCDNGPSVISKTAAKTSISTPAISTVTTTLSKQEFLTCCMDLLKDGFPLHLFDEGSSFKRLLQPLEDLFQTNLSSATLKIMMENDENQLKEKTAVFKHVTADDC